MTHSAEPGRSRPRRHWFALAAIAILLLVTAFASVQAASAHVRVPSQGTAGERITIRGTGFGSGQSGNLTYNGAVIEPFKASGSGTFRLGFTIPRWARLGQGRISAKTTSGALIATTMLAIVSTLGTATPAPTDPLVQGPSDTPSPGDTGPNPVGTPTPSDTSSPSDTPSDTPSATPSATPTDTPTDTPSSSPTGSDVPAFDHVYVIMFENREYSQVVGSGSAPYINSLINTYGASTTFYAETHPSEPNYFALVSGSTQGVNDDGNYNLGADNVFSQLSGAGFKWRTYAQGYPGNCFTGGTASSGVDGPGQAGDYVRKHNPAISFTKVSGNASECANITNLASFDPAAADFELIVPNLINDMHDGSVADGDNFLKAFLPQITNSAAFSNSVVFVTFDEGSSNSNGGGHVLTIAIPSDTTTPWDSGTRYTHYSILATMEDAWSLPDLGAAASAAEVPFANTGPSVGKPKTKSTTSPAANAPLPTASPAAAPVAVVPGATASRMALLTPCQGQANCYVYKVRSASENGSRVNDDLTSVARFFGVSTTAIFSLNPGLSQDVVPGQLIRIPPPTR